MFFIMLMNFCLATGPFFARYALLYMHPFLLVALRMLIAGIILCGAQLLYHRSTYKQLLHQLPHWRLLFMHGLLSMSLLCIFEAWALQGVTATKANLTWAALPLCTAAAVWLWFRKPIESLQKKAIFLGCCGIACLIMPELLLPSVCLSNACTIWHDISMIAAIVTAACGYIYIAKVAQSNTILLSNGISMCIGGAISLILAYLIEGQSIFICTNWPAALTYTSCIIVMVNLIGVSLQTWLTRTYSVVILTLTGCVGPIMGALLGFIQGDTWDFWLILSALLIGIALALLHYTHVKKVPAQ
jgi:drug/metabolite transporter (DMT)-like permease